MALREFSLFTGCGGGLLASEMLGWETVSGCELDKFARNILLQRQLEGHLGVFPIWDDIRTLDGTPWSGSVDIVSGGFPCQDISSAGKRRGLAGAKSGLWEEMRRVVSEIKPEFVFVENSPLLIHNGLSRVLQDLNALGFDAEWGVLGASDLGAPTKRQRFWLVGRNAANADHPRERVQSQHEKVACTRAAVQTRGTTWWRRLPDLKGVAIRSPNRVHRNRLTGNCQVPIVAATAFRILRGRLV